MYVGGWAFVSVMLIISVLAQDEVYRMLADEEAPPKKVFGFLIAASIALSNWVPYMEDVWVVALVGLLIDLVFVRPVVKPIQAFANTLVGVVYPTYLLWFVVRLREAGGLDDESAFYLTLAFFLMIWATDTFAYYTGRALGKHPLAPTISPKKTWEGSAGGALGAIVVAVGLKLTVLTFLPWAHLVVMALICGIISQMGDLTESRFKRSVGVKDSGTIIPGHGGVLDRFDAVIVAAPLVYLYLADVAQLFR